MNTAERSMGLGPARAQPAGGLAAARPDGPAQAAWSAGCSRARARAFARRGPPAAPSSAAAKLARPARQAHARAPELFDLTPDEEQQMLREAIGAFAAEQVRPAALAADNACATPAELLAQAGELGVATLGRARGARRRDGRALGRHERAASPRRSPTATSGSRFAALAPGRGRERARPVGRRRAAGHLPARVHRPRARRRPRSRCSSRGRCSTRCALTTRARREEGEWILSGAKSLVPRAADGRAVRDRRRRRGPRAGAVRRRVRHRAACSPSPSRRWACARRPPAG